MQTQIRLFLEEQSDQGLSLFAFACYNVHSVIWDVFYLGYYENEHRGFFSKCISILFSYGIISSYSAANKFCILTRLILVVTLIFINRTSPFFILGVS